VEQLRQYNPTSANAIANDVASAKQDVEKRLNDLNAQPRAERDDPPKIETAPGPRASSASPTPAPKAAPVPRPERPAVAAAAPPTAPPPPGPHAADEEAIRRTFRAFEAAYAKQSFEALRKVQSGLEQKSFQRTFEDVVDYRVTLKDLEFQFQSDRRASVITKVTELIMKQDSGKTTVGTVINYPTLLLEKRGDNWTIATPVVTK